MEDAEEDEEDLVCTTLFRAAENSALDKQLAKTCTQSKPSKAKDKKDRKGKKSKRKTSSSSSSSSSSSQDSSSEAVETGN